MHPPRSHYASGFLRLLCALVLFGFAQRAMAVEGAYVMVGNGQDVNVYGVALSWAPWATWPVSTDGVLSLRGTAGVAYWDSRKGDSDKSLVAVSAYPILRLDLPPVGGIVPYIEGSVGFNLLSRTRIGEHQLSTAFQFGEFAGVGIAFGDNRQFDLGVRYQHVSNADIKKPNDGLTYGSVVFQYRFGSR